MSKKAVFIYALIVVIILIIALIKVAIMIYKGEPIGPYGIVGNRKYGEMKTVNILDNEIMTIYGKCGVSDIFGGNSYKVNEDGIKGETIVVFYESPIDENSVIEYREYLLEEGFTQLNSDKLFCVRNNEKNNTFMFIISSGAQIKYTAMYGKYEEYMDKFEL